MHQRVFVEFVKKVSKIGADVIPLKGIYLSEAIYGDIGLRHLSDIDVLIREGDLNSICEMGKSTGWEVKETIKRSDLETDQFAHAHPFTLVKEDVRIELHTHLYNGGQGAIVSTEDLWTDTHKELFLGVPIRQVSSEMFLQHLCLHLHKHLFGYELKILNFCDIREFINVRGNNFNWNRFRGLCRTYQCTKEVNEVLFLCQKFWSVKVPYELEEMNLSTAELENRFWSYLNGQSRSKKSILNNRRQMKIRDIKQLDTYRDKSNYLLGFIFPKPSFMRNRYRLSEKDWLLPWYIYRPIELSLKAIRSTF